MKLFALFFLCLTALPAFAADAPPQTLAQQIASVKADEQAAIEKVVKIVNQPVTHLKRNFKLPVAVYSPGWFHPGAIKPDFNTVDVRKTQELPYEKQTLVTSDLNPDEMFIGNQLEFNPMTKYFYVDRSVPKKRLTEPEMLQINRLYRIIGADEQKLAELQKPAVSIPGLATSRFGLVAIAVALSVVLLFVFGFRKKSEDE